MPSNLSLPCDIFLTACYLRCHFYFPYHIDIFSLFQIPLFAFPYEAKQTSAVANQTQYR